jgi:hypothetical protein
VRELIEAAKTIEGPGWDAARREQFLRRCLARAEKERERRRVMRAFATGASIVLLAGLLLHLAGGFPALARPAPELAGKVAGQRHTGE